MSSSLRLSLQVAHGYLQHVSFVTGGDVDDYGAWIELESLLETYDLSFPDVRECKQGFTSACILTHCAWLCYYASVICLNLLIQHLKQLVWVDLRTTTSAAFDSACLSPNILPTHLSCSNYLAIAVMHPTMKHWVKRPLHDQLVAYAVGAVNPLWELGVRMMKSVGEAGVAGTIRMSKQSIQYHYDAPHKDLPDEERRYVSLMHGVHGIASVAQSFLLMATARASIFVTTLICWMVGHADLHGD